MAGRLRPIHAGWLLALSLALAACNASGRPVAGTAAPAGGPTPGTADAQGNYTVINGDTVYGVAKRFQVPLRSIIDDNRLKAPYVLKPGQTLRIPAQRIHVVRAGETLDTIARDNGVDQSALSRLNALSPPYALQPGRTLILPAPVQQASTTPGGIASPAGSVTAVPLDAPPPPAATAATTTVVPGTVPTPSAKPAPALPSAAPSAAPLATPGAGTAPTAGTQTTTATTSTTTQTATAADPAAPSSITQIPQPAPRAGGFFLWPVNGKVISQFGAKNGGLHNDGINIAAPRNTPVRAAENGVVVYSGNQIRGFGNLLLIRHSDGWVTAYAHNETLLVKKGQQVKRGETIARVGSTGNVSQPQLHFELRKGTEAVDPAAYLAPPGA
jgi:murein DD-endopeptidase MepM/ murein hydrolase activator NlpD